MKDRVGQQFGNYRLLRFLGHGGFADVYLGEHIYLKNRAALKVLHTRVSEKDGQQFLIEAQTLAQFSHPHIVRVLDFGIEERTAFLVMDYLPHGTLRQRHPPGSCLSLEQITSYVEQIASALLYLHESRRLIHRDIKPENLLLGANNQVQLADFGISLVVPSQHQLEGQAKAGTRPYMAPELFEGKPVFASDQYALGIMVYEWLCGTRPFHGNALALLYQQAVVSPPSLLAVDPSLPPEVEAVVFKALAKDPTQRYQSVRHFAQALWQACQRNQASHYLSAAPGAQNPQPVSGATPSRRIFVCHARSDEALGKRLATDLRKQGMAVWLAQGAVPANEASPDGVSEEEVRRAIRAADAVLLVASAETSSSIVVQQQLNLVGRYQRHVVGVLFPDTDLSSCLPQPWSPTIQVDQVEMRRRAYEQVLADVLTACACNRMEEEPEEEPVGEPRSPYKGLRPFTQTDAADFFGRERLVDALVKQVYRMTLPAQGGDTASPNETIIAENTAGGALVFDQIALNSSYSREQQKRATMSDSKPCSAPEPHAVLPTTSNRLLAVLGPSGSGKSSVVLAGLLPRLSHDGGAEKGRWIILSPMLPGDHPLEALALTLASHLPTDRRAHLHDTLANKGATGLHQLAQQITHQPDQKVVLFIDQLEEIFAPMVSEQERQQFFDLIVTAVTQPRGPMIVLLALRADFYHRCIAYPTLHQLMEQQHQTVYPMDVDDLRAVIRGPAALPDVQLAFEGNLVGALLFEVQDRPGALPLLQFTLEQLFLHRQGHLLTLQAYREIGGVRGALVQHLEQVYMALPSEEHRDLTRTLFLRLIEPGIGEQDITRRRAFLTEFTLPDPSRTHLLREVLDAFLHARLLTTNEIAGITTVEVSHEAVIHAWQRLNEWIRTARQDLQLQQRVSRDAADWQRSGKPHTRLYRGPDLKEAQYWARRNSASQQEHVFLRASNTRQFRSLLMVIALILLVVSSSGIASWVLLFQPNPDYVTTTNDDGTGSLRWAIKNAPAKSTITFAPMLRGQTILLTTTDIHITQQNLTIQGPATGRITIQVRRVSIVVDKPAMVTIDDIDFQGSSTNFVSVIQNAGKLTLKMCSISDNTASEDIGAGPFTNTSGATGGGIDNIGVLTLTNSTLSNNTASSSSQTGAFGGGIFSSGTVTLTNSTLSGNSASGTNSKSPGFGGGIDSGGTLTLINSTLSGNSASDGGGGIDNAGTLTLTNSTLSNNTVGVGSGGGIFNSGTATLTNSTLSGNTTSGSNVGGGGVANAGTLTLTNSTLSNNTAFSSNSIGGGIYNISKVTLTNSTLSNNTALGHGGGIANGNTATLINSTLSGNSASDGGGIFNISKITVINSTLLNNTAFSSNSIGGGIFNAGTATLTNSILSDNTAFSSNSGGGGIFNTGALTLINSTLSDNTAFYGGNIATTGQTLDKPAKTASVTLMFCTLVNEKAVTHDGFDITIEESNPPIGPEVMFQLVMKATIVGGKSTQARPIIGVITSEGYNVIQNMPSVQFTVNSAHTTDHSIDTLMNVFGSAPALQKNGGLTETYRLIPNGNDPAWNDVPLTACTDSTNLPIGTDQRGLSRPGRNKTSCDSGSYETQDSHEDETSPWPS